MSGGVAYLFDPDLHLERRLNTEFVEIELLDDDDVALVADLTRSATSALTGVAARHPLCWPISLSTLEASMRKIIASTSYRRVLEATKAAIDSGQDVDVAVMAVAHG